MATILDSVMGGYRPYTPKITVGGSHVLNDPNRPTGASDRDAARSQLEYLTRELAKGEPRDNAVFQALVSAGASIRTQQSRDLSGPGPGATDGPDAMGAHRGTLPISQAERVALAQHLEDLVSPARGAGLADGGVDQTRLLLDAGVARQALRAELGILQPEARDARDAALRAEGAREGLALAERGDEGRRQLEGPRREEAMRRLRELPVAGREDARSDEEARRISQERQRRNAAMGRLGRAQDAGLTSAERDSVSEAAAERAVAPAHLADERAARLMASLTRSAVEEGYNGKAPDGADGKAPGFDGAWSGGAGREYRGSLAALAASARAIAADENAPAVEHNAHMAADARRAGLPAPAKEDLEPTVAARPLYDRMVSVIPDSAAGSAGRRTDYYEVAADNPLTSRVLTSFVELGLKASDAGRSPSAEGLAADVARIRAIYAVEEKARLPSIERIEVAGTRDLTDRDLRSLPPEAEAQGPRLLAAGRAIIGVRAEAARMEPDDMAARRDLGNGMIAVAKAQGIGRTESEASSKGVRGLDRMAESGPGRALRDAMAGLGEGAREIAAASGGERSPGQAFNRLMAMIPSVPEGVILREGMKEVTVRPVINGPNPFASHIIGVEGQAFYGNGKAIEDALSRKMAEPGRPKTFITYAQPTEERDQRATKREAEGGARRAPSEDKMFLESLTDAAGRAGLRVVKGELRLRRALVSFQSTEGQSHVDTAGGREFVRDTRRAMMTTRELVVEHPSVKDAKGKPLWVPLDSKEGTELTRGALVTVAIKSQDNFRDFGRVDGALTSGGGFIAFGDDNRSERLIWKQLGRRQLSGMPQGEVIDKYGQVMDPAKVRVEIASRGKSPAASRVETNDLITSGDKDNGTERDKRWRSNEARTQMLASRVVGTTRARALLDGFPGLGEALEAVAQARKDGPGAYAAAEARGVGRPALSAAVALEKAYRNPQEFSAQVQSVRAVVEPAQTYAAMMGATLLVDPRDPAVRMGGAQVGWSSQEDRTFAGVRRYAVIGDDGPLDAAGAEQIDKVVSGLAKVHAAQGTRFALSTTLTEGVGEAVMAAGLRHGVPVEAYSGTDDRKVRDGTPELARLMTARDLWSKGLGGTWSLAAYTDTGPVAEASPSMAARAAIAGSDAVIASQVGRDSPILMVVAAAGRTKPLAALSPPGADGAGWEGTEALGRPRNQMTLVIPNSIGSSPSFVAAGARLFPQPGGRMTEARLDTGAGAFQLKDGAALKELVEAAAGGKDLTLGRGGPENRMAVRGAEPGEAPIRAASPADAAPGATKVRWEVMAALGGEEAANPAYRKAAGLRPAEERLAAGAVTWQSIRTMTRDPDDLRSRLGVGPQPRVPAARGAKAPPARARSAAGMEVG